MTDAEPRRGPLSGLRIIELAHIGPVPHCAMLLSDLGATVLRIERLEPSGLGVSRPIESDITLRGRKAIALDLKRPDAVSLVLRLVGRSDAMIEGYRPGVMERLGLGPAPCLAANPKLVYGRLTGWGQDGPLSRTAGHDLNYIALTGALASIGRAGDLPTPPLNLVGDYGGGSLYLVMGVLAAIWSAGRTGQGQIVDASVIDGTASLMASLQGLHAAGIMDARRGHNLLDSGAFFYDVYECQDGRHVSVAPIEGKFYRTLLDLVGIDPNTMPSQRDSAAWPQGRAILAARFKMRTRQEWTELLEGSEACFAPVLELHEVAEHAHHRARSTYIAPGGVTQPAPAPRFDRTPLAVPSAPVTASACQPEDVLSPWLSPSEIAQFYPA